MKMCVVSVFDLCAQAFGRPAFVVSRGSAVRSFLDECARDVADNVMYSHPSDFVLYCLGEFDDSNAHFELLQVPERLVVGSNGVK